MKQRIETLRRRADVVRAIRGFFDARGFIEVQTPVLSADTIVDRHVEPVAVVDDGLPLNHHGTRRYFLQTSPEFAMKRLLAAGMRAIYQFAPVFRKGDRGRRHNVEFTMLEWYRAGDDYQAGIDLLVELVRTRTPGLPEPRRSAYGDLFLTATGLDAHRAAPAEFRALADRRGVAYPASYAATADADDWRDLLFGELVQPGLDSAVVYDFPAPQSQLARTRQDGEIEVAERFELYLRGLEIANGYHELLDAAELRRRFQENAALRTRDGRAPLPTESRLLRAMESGLPASCGTALGLERLLMILFDADSIDEVLAFPIELA